jgi:hypothetical protein
MADNTERLKELTKKFLGRPPYVIHRMPNAPRDELNGLLPEHLEHQVRLEKSGVIFAAARCAASCRVPPGRSAPRASTCPIFVIDGAVPSARRPDPADRPNSPLEPDAIVEIYIDALGQHHSASSREVEARPCFESFRAPSPASQHFSAMELST